jgi:hypothetical protein
MSYISDFTFNNISRIGNDGCCIDQNSIQNTLASSYMLQNFYMSDCSMKNPIALATSQPCVNYKGCQNTCAGGSNIDVSSNLLIGTIQTHPKCHISLFQRPFATVPYLGRGSVCPILESQIQQGDLLTNKKSISQLSEKNYAKYKNTPLIPQIRNNITNPEKCVEEVADPNFIRGGIPSRELTKDNNYYTTNTKYQYTG